AAAPCPAAAGRVAARSGARGGGGGTLLGGGGAVPPPIQRYGGVFAGPHAGIWSHWLCRPKVSLCGVCGTLGMMSGSTLGVTVTPSARVTDAGIWTLAGQFRSALWAHGNPNRFSSV